MQENWSLDSCRVIKGATTKWSVIFYVRIKRKTKPVFLVLSAFKEKWSVF